MWSRPACSLTTTSILAEYDVIGDVHGCLHTLKRLLSELGYGEDGHHPAGRRLAFVGDLVTRGLHSEETFVLAMRPVVFTSSPSEMCWSGPMRMHPTLSSSRLKAMP